MRLGVLAQFGGVSNETSAQDWQLGIDKIKLAESLGVECVMVSEAWGLSAIPWMSLIATQTNSIQIGSCILNSFSRSPAALAQEFASLEDEQDSMKRQFGRMIQYLNCLPVTTLSIDNVEADDIMAYIANEIYTKDENRVTICSTDRDFLQLVNKRISVWSPIKKKMYTPSVMQEEFGFSSKNYLLYRSFIGDKSDNIPGLKGVGPKSLIKYFPMFSEDRELSVQEIVEYAANVDKKYKVHELVSNNKELLELNYKLMQLKEVDINGNAKMLTLDKVKGDIDKLNTYQFKKMFMADKMYTVIKDLDSWLNSSFNSLNAYASL